MHRYLDERGFLPEGEHHKDWAWLESLTINKRRKLLLQKAKGFCQNELACFSDTPNKLFIAGSFLSDKENPSDIEILLDLKDMPENRDILLKIFSLQCLHDKIHQDLEIDFYLTTPFNENDFSQWFQYVGEKSAQAKDLKAKDLRGIVRIDQWHLD